MTSISGREAATSALAKLEIQLGPSAFGRSATVSLARQVCRPTRTSRTGERSLVDPSHCFTSDCLREVNLADEASLLSYSDRFILSRNVPP